MTNHCAISSLNVMLIAVAVACFTARFEAHAQESKEEIDGKIESKHKEIEAELKWAGSYKQVGTDEIDVVTIAQSGKIVFFQECQGRHYKNSGNATVVGQELQVAWDYDEERRNCSLGDRLLVVPWGNASFLIPRSEVHSFCLRYRNQDNRTSSPVRSDYVRFEGEIKLDEKPQLPDEFKKYWDLPPIECQITAVGDAVRKKGDLGGDRKLTCTINKGSADDIFVGMSLYARDKLNVWTFTVTKVETRSATLETNLRRPFKEPSEGCSVTSN